MLKIIIFILISMPMQSQEIYTFTMKDLSGKEIDFQQFKGKPILLVNTASECGLTPQYEDLQHIHEKYKKRGLVVIGFPSNDFGQQEPGNAEEIRNFCSKNYGVTFLMMNKVQVKGEQIVDLYRYLTKETDSEVSWNFQKYLISKDGKNIKMIPPKSRMVEEKNISLLESFL